MKAHSEFNLADVESQRLLGFEKGTLTLEDFIDDKVISERVK